MDRTNAAPPRPVRAVALAGLVVVVGLAPALASPTPAAAQVPAAEEVIPLEFAEAFIRAGRDGLRVGEIAEALEPWVTPTAGARVVGSVVRGGPSPSFATTVLAAPGEPRGLAQEWRNRLVEAGLTPAPEERSFGRHGGFAEARTPTRAMPLCAPDGGTISVSGFRSSAGTESFVSISYQPRPSDGQSWTPCLPRPPRDGFERLEIPHLVAPDGVTVRSDGTSSSGRSGWTQAEFQGPVVVPELARHFARQMEEQGWARTDGATGDAVTVSLWERLDEEGVRLQAALVMGTRGDDGAFGHLVVQTPPES